MDRNVWHPAICSTIFSQSRILLPMISGIGRRYPRRSAGAFSTARVRPGRCALPLSLNRCGHIMTASFLRVSARDEILFRGTAAKCCAFHRCGVSARWNDNISKNFVLKIVVVGRRMRYTKSMKTGKSVTLRLWGLCNGRPGLSS